MRRIAFYFAFIGVVVLVSACAKPSLYRSWALQLDKVSSQNARLEDISLLLGSSPSRCDSIDEPTPMIGVAMNSQKPIIDFVRIGGPAQKAGLQAGDVITRVAGESVTKKEQALAAIRQNARDGEPLEVETRRGLMVVVPTLPKTEQCYWEIQAGEVTRAGGSAYANKWGGSAHAGGASYQRFFRASCRVYDGVVGNCQANWQE